MPLFFPLFYLFSITLFLCSTQFLALVLYLL